MVEPAANVVNGAVASTVKELVAKLSPVKVKVACDACRVLVKPSAIMLNDPAPREHVTAVTTGAVRAMLIVVGESPVATIAAPPLVNWGVMVMTPARVPAFRVKFTTGLVLAGTLKASVRLPFEN